MTYLKKPHLSLLSIASALLLSACGGGGGGSSTTPISQPTATDTVAPNVSFNPNVLTVESQASANSNLSATDSFGVTSGPTVSCTNGGSFNVTTNSFTAASVDADTQSVCTAVASDAAGNQGSATLTVTMTAIVPDTTAPVLTFGPANLVVTSGQTASSTLTVTDDSALSSGPTVTCTNGGSFNVTTNIFTAAAVEENTESVCTATATDDAGNQGTATLTVSMTPAPVTQAVTLSGTLTFDRVPVFENDNGLDFDNIVRMPIRQATVDLLNASGAVLESTVSDDAGAYSFTVDSGQNVRVRVRSEIQMAGDNLVDMQVVDNTSSDSLYAVQGALSVLPSTNQVRNLNAASGWGGSSYTTARAAAPFALLDTIYTALEGFIAVDPDVDFPAFLVQWSTRNRAESGNVAAGQIGTSSFTTANGAPVIRILGDENNDTDEYDVHVVVHEFGHYFENSLSRADSIGGAHSSNDRLDARVAFGEGWGNALSGMILDNPFYRDSFGNQQGQSFDINVENNIFPASTGWYSEGSVQSILYDLFDDDDDGADTVSFGLAPIYGAFVDPDYQNTEAFTSIFAFLNALDNQPGITSSGITALTESQDINGSGEFGLGETNNGGLTMALPVYLNLPTNNTPVTFCSNDNFGEFNNHGNRRFLVVNFPTADTYTISMQRSSGATISDPEFFVFRQGVAVGAGLSGANNSESDTRPYAAGVHVIDAYAFENVDTRFDTIDVCYTMRAEAQ